VLECILRAPKRLTTGLTTSSNPEAPGPAKSNFSAQEAFSSRRSTAKNPPLAPARSCFRKDPRFALPFLRAAWSRQTVRATEGDVLLSSSNLRAHGLPSEIPKVVYCYNPARWRYQSETYMAGQPRFVRGAVRQYAKSLLRWDAQAAQSASRYIAISRVVQARIHAAYGIRAEVLHPPITLPTATRRSR